MLFSSLSIPVVLPCVWFFWLLLGLRSLKTKNCALPFAPRWFLNLASVSRHFMVECITVKEISLWPQQTTFERLQFSSKKFVVPTMPGRVLSSPSSYTPEVALMQPANVALKQHLRFQACFEFPMFCIKKNLKD